MRESRWEDCIEENSAVKVTPDTEKAKSLKKTARGRMRYLSRQKIEEDSANYIFEGYYSSIIELVHAIALMNGYNITNHLCLGYFLRDFLKKHDLFRLFDDCRIKRNSIVYYGKLMDISTARLAISNSMKLLKELERMIS